MSGEAPWRPFRFIALQTSGPDSSSFLLDENSRGVITCILGSSTNLSGFGEVTVSVDAVTFFAQTVGVGEEAPQIIEPLFPWVPLEPGDVINASTTQHSGDFLGIIVAGWIFPA